MTVLKLHTIDSTPEKSRALLQSSIDNFGWIPNQSAYMSESPSLLGAYQRAHDLFIASSLDETQKAVVWITTGLANRCEYTVHAHASIALAKGVDASLVDAIAHHPERLDASLRALRDVTLAVIHCRGHLARADIDEFLEAGFSEQNLLDVILGVSQKNMSTILNSVARTAVDTAFRWPGFQGLQPRDGA